MNSASCHCGAIKLIVKQLPDSLTACNCSICRRLAVLWAYYRPDDVEISCLPDALSSYSWGKEHIAFHFCRSCGCTTHYTMTPTSKRTKTALNARMLPHQDITGIPIRNFDGASSWKYLDD